MTINEKDGKLTIFLEGRIDTNNAAQTESELFAAVGGVKLRTQLSTLKNSNTYPAPAFVC